MVFGLSEVDEARLILACKHGSDRGAELVRWSLEATLPNFRLLASQGMLDHVEGCDHTTVFYWDNTLEYHLIRTRNVEKLRILLDRQTEYTDPSMLRVAIHYPDAEDDTTMLKVLLDDYPHLVDLNARSAATHKLPHFQQTTMLMRAAEHCRHRSIGVLLEHGADVNAETLGGWTALHILVYYWIRRLYTLSDYQRCVIALQDAGARDIGFQIDLNDPEANKHRLDEIIRAARAE